MGKRRGDHVSFALGIGIFRGDRLDVPPARAHGAVVPDVGIFSIEDVHDGSRVRWSTATCEDPHGQRLTGPLDITALVDGVHGPAPSA
jgi:hypothetical protein